jgi:hypothetical protein
MNASRKRKTCLPLLGALTWAAAGCQSEVSPPPTPASSTGAESAAAASPKADPQAIPPLDTMKKDDQQAIGALDAGTHTLPRNFMRIRGRMERRRCS